MYTCINVSKNIKQNKYLVTVSHESLDGTDLMQSAKMGNYHKITRADWPLLFPQPMNLLLNFLTVWFFVLL